MPTYEYQCKACGHQLEEFQKMSDAPLTDCPKCHQPALGKLVSATGFQLKGSGWYLTDYKGKKPDTASGSSTEKKNEKTSSSSSESTSE